MRKLAGFSEAKYSSQETLVNFYRCCEGVLFVMRYDNFLSPHSHSSVLRKERIGI